MMQVMTAIYTKSEEAERSKLSRYEESERFIVITASTANLKKERWKEEKR